MKPRLLLAGLALGFSLVVLVVVRRALEHRASHSTPTAATSASSSESREQTHPGFLYGRVSTVEGGTYEGRLRWGGGQEAFWGDFFNGAKAENRWATEVSPERLPKEIRPFSVFGVEVFRRERPRDLGRLFLARFGDLARIEARGREVRVTLKSGTVFDLDRLEASDFDDGVRVWDNTRGEVNLDSLRIKTIEFLPTAWKGQAPARLFGKVTTAHGEFTGFLQWNREKGLGSDELSGRGDDGELSMRLDSVRSVVRRNEGGMVVTLSDGREVGLEPSNDPWHQRGLYVDDQRYGRVLVSWQAFERVDFAATGDSGPAYGDFAPGQPLSGNVTTRDGRLLAGRLVFDLDESETTETLDAPRWGVDYTLPLSLVESIELPNGEEQARVTLKSGESLELEMAGDLGPANLGLLVFVAGEKQPEYLPWAEVAGIHFEPN